MAYNYEYPYTDPNRYNADWLLKSVKELLTGLEGLNDWKDKHEEEYQELKDLYDDFMDGKIPPKLENSLILWIKKNAQNIINEVIKNVYFGITDSGYFVAYSPDSWADIIFSTTGLEHVDEGYEFGRLILSFNVDEEGI